MVKSLSALLIFSLLGASVIALPGFAPKVEAREAGILAKGDRLEIRSAALNCSSQIWPNLASSCLRSAASDGKVVGARLVTARR
jgi:hypothetical protein